MKSSVLPLRAAGALAALLSMPALAGNAPLADPADPAAAAPEIRYERALDAYRPLPAFEPLPWRRIFDASGEFVPERVLLAQAQSGGHASHGAGSGSAPAPAAAGADATGSVQSIDKAGQKVKLKHGPIPKLDMPGMTMVFRVRDPAMLDAVREGETVGFDVEKQGSSYVITRWAK